MPKSKRYSIAEARASFPNVVKEAEAGSEVELTRRGRPVAVLISLDRWESLRANRPRFADAYRNFLVKYSLKEVGLEAGMLQSDRDKDPGREVSL